ncbi:MAG: hypothetical protein RL417_2322 [Pseudomonadota bacterium]|jgi:hypothetical protein
MGDKFQTTATLGARSFFVASTVLFALGSLSGCSSIFSETTPLEPPQEVAWLNDGLLAIARPVPPVASSLALLSSESTTSAPVIDSASLLAFMPLPPTQIAAWLSIDTAKQTVSLMSGQQMVKSEAVGGMGSLKPGLYKVAHKQESPSWHAPDSYFTARGLPVPPEGDRARLRRGALGERALFLDKDTPLHDGPIWSSEIGGVKLNEGFLAELYAAIDVGATIEVK